MTCPKWIVERPIAHRGLHQRPDAPENSLKAFGLAIERSYPIELDVRLVADGHAVVFHDDNLLRATDVDTPLAASTLNDIRHLKLFGSDERIPTLAEVLEFVAGRVPLLVEIKNERGEIGPLESAVRRTLAGYAGDYAVQSFNPRSLEWFRATAPDIPRGQLSSDFTDVAMPWHYKFFLRAMLLNWRSSPSFVAYDLRGLPFWAATLARSRGKPLIAWTIRTMEEYERARGLADNVIFECIRPK